MEIWQEEKTGGLQHKGRCQMSKWKGGSFQKTETGLKVRWDDLETGLGFTWENCNEKQVFKGRRNEPRNLSCISKAVCNSLKCSRDILASDECDIDKLLKHGLNSRSADSRAELQWEVFETASFSQSDYDDSKQTFGSSFYIFASQEKRLWQFVDTFIDFEAWIQTISKYSNSKLYTQTSWNTQIQ